MWANLAALLQILNEQRETVLSDVSRKALEACVKTGTCNRISLSKVCSSLKCSYCEEVIDGKWFYISCAIWRNQYIECEVCSDKNSGWSDDKYYALSVEDREFIESCDGKYVYELTDKENERLEGLINQCYDLDLPENWEEEEEKFHKEMEEDKKIVYPKGRYRKAHWEELLKARGVPLIPKQLER